jgi:hypothetical protein
MLFVHITKIECEGKPKTDHFANILARKLNKCPRLHVQAGPTGDFRVARFTFLSCFFCMKTSLASLALRALLPAAVLLASCGKKDEPAPAPAPDQGRINALHMAGSANLGIKVLFDDADKGTLTFGQNSGYQGVNTGSRTVKINNGTTGANLLTKTFTVEKDKYYSYFVYGNTNASVADLLVTDDLSAPSSGKAKIRLVNLGQGATTPLQLATTAGAYAPIVGTETQFANASGFVEIIPGSYNVAVTSGTGTSIATVDKGNVGDGSGNNTVANKNYEAGKIYTVIYRGVSGSLIDPSLTPKAVIIQNN